MQPFLWRASHHAGKEAKKALLSEQQLKIWVSEVDANNPTSMDPLLIFLDKNYSTNKKEALFTQSHQIKNKLAYIIIDNCNQKKLVS